MKKKALWKLLLFLGTCPFLLPFLLGLYRMTIETWSLLDFLVLYSFLYWPTYLIGFVLILISISKLITKESL